MFKESVTRFLATSTFLFAINIFSSTLMHENAGYQNLNLSNLTQLTLSYLFFILFLAAFILIRSKLLRYCMLAILFIVLSVQFAAIHNLGNPISAEHIFLASENRVSEMKNAVMLYFHWPALVASLFITGVYIVLLNNQILALNRNFVVIFYISIFLLFSGTTWGLSRQNQSTKLSEPLTALAQGLTEFGFEHLRRIKNKLPERDTVSPPTGTPLDISYYYIVGESISSEHLPQYGYHRNTMPKLQQITSEFPSVIFNNVIAHGDCTNRSVPQLLSQPSFPARAAIAKMPTLFTYAKAPVTLPSISAMLRTSLKTTSLTKALIQS